MQLKHISMFSGIGGPELAAEWCGWENISHTEWNPFGRNVLHYYWPQADSHEDATKTDYTIYRGRANVLSAGFPCQGYSLAGKRLGTDDDRYHWPTVRRAYNESRPDWCVFENVTGLLSMEDKQGVWRDVFAKVEGGTVIRTLECDYYEKVYTRQAKMLIGTIIEDLENDGYRPQLFVIPAASVGAPHKRARVFVVAHTFNEGLQGAEFKTIIGKEYTGKGKKHIGRAASEFYQTSSWDGWPFESPVCDGNDGVSAGLDFETVFEGYTKPFTWAKWRNESIKAGGNAIVPQVMYQIFKTINDVAEMFPNNPL